MSGVPVHFDLFDANYGMPVWLRKLPLSCRDLERFEPPIALRDAESVQRPDSV